MINIFLAKILLCKNFMEIQGTAKSLHLKNKKTLTKVKVFLCG
jgi:hypothetical protein